MPELPAIEPDRVVYKRIDDICLHMDIFRPAPDAASARPAIVFFHGGGWRGGAPTQFHPHCRYLAGRGMIAASAEYRLVGQHTDTPFDCVTDGKSAVRWLRAHAADLGIDAARLATGGGSAGGHVAACTGTLSAPDAPGEDLAVSSVPAAMTLFNPVVDTTETGWGGGPPLLGERARELSPTHHVRPGAPPTIIFHGTADTTVPIENPRRFTRLMRSAGNRCELHTFEGHAHGFFNYCRDGNAAFIETVCGMDRFLVSLGFLAGEPTI